MPLICPICWSGLEDDSGGVECVALACGHVFHLHCLVSWLQQNPTCAHCRAPVSNAPTEVRKIFFSTTEVTAAEELKFLEQRLHRALAQNEEAGRNAQMLSQQLERVSQERADTEVFASTLLKDLIATQQEQTKLKTQLRISRMEKAELLLRLRESEQLVAVHEQRVRLQRQQAAVCHTGVDPPSLTDMQ